MWEAGKLEEKSETQAETCRMNREMWEIEIHPCSACKQVSKSPEVMLLGWRNIWRSPSTRCASKMVREMVQLQAFEHQHCSDICEESLFKVGSCNQNSTISTDHVCRSDGKCEDKDKGILSFCDWVGILYYSRDVMLKPLIIAIKAPLRVQRWKKHHRIWLLKDVKALFIPHDENIMWARVFVFVIQQNITELDARPLQKRKRELLAKNAEILVLLPFYK